MPSKTFYNLNSDKRQKLIDCAMDEFCNYSLDNVSINRIVNNAGISRGSFYTYFNDKEDLFCYLLESFRNRIDDLVYYGFLSNDGDIRSTFIFLYDEFIDNFFKYEYFDFFKNTFIYMNSKTERFVKPSNLFDKILPLISTSVAYCDLNVVFDMFMHNLYAAVVKTLNNDFDRDMYIKTLDVLCYGIYKEDIND